MIQVKKIEPQTVHVFGPGILEDLGFLNEYEFTDLRAQIYTGKVSGYSFAFNNRLYCIDENGRYDKPEGLFDNIQNNLIVLCKKREDGSSWWR